MAQGTQTPQDHFAREGRVSWGSRWGGESVGSAPHPTLSAIGSVPPPALTFRTCHHHPANGPPPGLGLQDPAALSTATPTPTPTSTARDKLPCCLDIPSPLPLAPLHALTPNATLPFRLPPSTVPFNTPNRGFPALCSLAVNSGREERPLKSGSGAWRATQMAPLGGGCAGGSQ